MRDIHDACHIAIPARDLDEALDYYVFGLGCKLARRYDDRITLDFFGDQLVCHLSDDIPAEAVMYPRHFGVSFAKAEDFNLSKSRSPDAACASRCSAISSADTDLLRWNRPSRSTSSRARAKWRSWRDHGSCPRI